MRYFLLIVFIFCFFQPATAQKLYKWEKQEIKDIMWPKYWRKGGSIDSQIFGIYEDNEVLYEKGNGHSNFPIRRSINNQTIFYSGITGQVITAICILNLWQEKKLNLDDSIRKYFDHLPQKFEPITIRHLLAHTSGIRGYLSFIKKRTELDFTIDQIVDVWGTFQHEGCIYFNAGEKQLFSESNYWLLAKIFGKVTGSSLQDYAHRIVFDPLQMNQTFFSQRESLIQKAQNAQDSYYFRPFAQFEGIGEGGLYTSLSDLRKFGRAFFQESFFTDQIIKQFLNTTILNSGHSTKMGFAGITELSINGKKAYQFPLEGNPSTCGLIYIPEINTFFIHLNCSYLNFTTSIRKVLTTLYGDDWIDGLTNNFEGIQFIEQVNIYNGEYIDHNSGRIRKIYFDFEPVLSESKKLTPRVKTIGKELSNYSNPVIALSINRFVSTSENIEWEFIPDSLGYRLKEYKNGVLQGTYIKHQPFNYSKEELNVFTGIYSYSLNKIWYKVEVYLQKNVLHMRWIDTKQKGKFKAISKDKFHTSNLAIISFTRDEDTKVTGFYESTIFAQDQFYEKIE